MDPSGELLQFIQYLWSIYEGYQAAELLIIAFADAFDANRDVSATTLEKATETMIGELLEFVCNAAVAYVTGGVGLTWSPLACSFAAELMTKLIVERAVDPSDFA